MHQLVTKLYKDIRMFLSQQKNSKASNVSLTHEIVCRVLSVNFGGNSGLKSIDCKNFVS